MSDSERIKRMNKIIFDRLSSLNSNLTGGNSGNKIAYVRYPEKCLNAFVEKYKVGDFSLDKNRVPTKTFLPDNYKKCFSMQKTIPYGDIAQVASFNCEIDKCDPTTYVLKGGNELTPELKNFLDEQTFMKNPADAMIKNWELLEGIFNTAISELNTRGIILESEDVTRIKLMIADYKKVIEKKISLEKYVNAIEAIRKEFGDNQLLGTCLNENNLEKITKEYNELYQKETEKVGIIIKLLGYLLQLK